MTTLTTPTPARLAALAMGELLTPDETAQLARLRNLRGKAWGNLFAELQDPVGKRINALFMESQQRVVDVGIVALKFGLPYATTCKFLEEGGSLPLGWHDVAVRRSVTATRILEAARKQLKVQP